MEVEVSLIQLSTWKIASLNSSPPSSMVIANPMAPDCRVVLSEKGGFRVHMTSKQSAQPRMRCEGCMSWGTVQGQYKDRLD